MTAGDLLLFSEREDDRITHVGVADGAGGMVHVTLSRGGFVHESLGTDHPRIIRLRSQLRAIRRVLPGR